MRALSRLCQLLCPPNRQMGTFAHSQPHATITAKLFCFSRNVESRRVVFGRPPALGAGGPEFKSRRPDHLLHFSTNIKLLQRINRPNNYSDSSWLDVVEFSAWILAALRARLKILELRRRIPDLPRHPGEAQIGIVDPTSAVQNSGSDGLMNSTYLHLFYIIVIHI
jgi:hypothetical protein